MQNKSLALLCVITIIVAMFWGRSQASDHYMAAAQITANTDIWLPLVLVPPAPAGAYQCNEFEYGMIWSSSVITLSADFSSSYHHSWYGNPSLSYGTWVYTPTEQLVQLNNFRWKTLSFRPPGQLYAERYIPTPNDFMVSIDCQRRRLP